MIRAIKEFYIKHYIFRVNNFLTPRFFSITAGGYSTELPATYSACTTFSSLPLGYGASSGDAIAAAAARSALAAQAQGYHPYRR